MNTVAIVYIIIAALAGAIITYFFIAWQKGKENKSLREIATDEFPDNLHEQELQKANRRAEDVKEKYDSLLAEAKSQIKTLDKQLKDCMDGHVDESVQQQLGEVNKLQEQIKALQEELEENEEDLDDYKKRLKKKESENSDLQDQLSKETRTLKRQAEELESLKVELEDKQDELNLKMQSLNFIQEVLSANVCKDNDSKMLYRKVDDLYDFIGGELRDAIKSIKSFEIEKESEVFGIDLKKWAIYEKKSWIKGKTTIAFVGDFSAGKTSIVNRILSQDNPDVPLLPVSTKATTAIPTYISGTSNSEAPTSYTFVSPDNLQKNITEETFKRINKEVLDQVKGVSSLIQYFVMNYKNENLSDISILDTPGFSSNDKEDAKRTIEVINECDALFWVIDVNLGDANRSSIALIKENLRKPLYVVINKIDTKAEEEVCKVEKTIRKTFQDSNIPVQQFIRFSGKAPLLDIMNPIKSINRNRQQDNYMDNIYEIITKLEKKQLNKVGELHKKYNQLSGKCDTLTNKYDRAIQKLRDNCQDAADVPHFETHFFGSDKFEMSESEYNHLVALLNTICDTRGELCDLYNEQMENQRKAQQAYSDYIDEKMNWHRIKGCKEELENKKESLKRQSYGTESV